MNIAQLLFSFKGRISRQAYWIFTSIYLAVIFVPALFIGADAEAAGKLMLAMILILFWPSLAIQAKRWHDRNKSAWWILINFVPAIGGIWAFVENGFLPGTESENRYG